jgi:subtilisin family serine protease
MVWKRSRPLLSLLVLLSTLFPTLATALPTTGAPIDPQILADMAAAADGRAGFFVLFHGQADLAGAAAVGDWTLRGRFVYDTLAVHAARAQAATRAWLQGRGIAYYPLLAQNALFVTADEPALRALAALPEVAALRANYVHPLEPVSTQQPPYPEGVAWGVALVGADDVWNDFDVSGSGIVVANIDTGVEYTHDALYINYKCGSGPHADCWYDPSAICPDPAVPCDNDGHGTHTMGTMVGDQDPGLLYNAGMAPDAQWIACKGCESSSCSDFALAACGDWVLAPNGDPANRPHIVNNSWGGGGCDTWYRPLVQAWRAAGIFPAFSAGNAGPDCNSLGSPGDYPESFASAATNAADEVADFSSRGPSCFGEIKPDISAPGVGVCSSVPGNSWSCSYSGTSMASPHTAGLVALLWSANSVLLGNFETTAYLITSTAICRTNVFCGGEECHNNHYGWGRIDAYAAVQAAFSMGSPAWLHGHVYDDATGNPLSGATVIADRQGIGRWTGDTNPSGYYTITLGAGAYTVTAEHPLYTSAFTAGLDIPSGTVALADFSLVPRGRLHGTVRDADSLLPLRATVTVPGAGTVETDPDTGAYEIYLDAGLYQASATAWNHVTGTAALSITAGQDTQQDFDLVAAVTFLPTPLEVDLTWLEVSSVTAAVVNRLPVSYGFYFAEGPSGFTPGGGAPEAGRDELEVRPYAERSIFEADRFPAPVAGELGGSRPAAEGSLWSYGAALPVGPQYGACGLSTDGQSYYHFGGGNAWPEPIRTAMRYDPATDTWSNLAPMPSALDNRAALYDPDGGLIYLGGGYPNYSPAFESYDPGTDSWTILSPMPHAKAGAAGGVVDGKVYLLGGNPEPINETQIYDIATSTWSEGTPLPFPTAYAASVTYDDHIYVIAGARANTFFRYDPASDSWEQGPSLNHERMSGHAVVSAEGILTIWGGGGYDGQIWEPWDDGERYDLRDWPVGSWKLLSEDPMPAPVVRGVYACAAGRLWVAGGASSGGYSDANQSWSGAGDCFVPGTPLEIPWLGQDPLSATVPASSTLGATMVFTATPAVGVDRPGLYRGELKLEGDPRLRVPVAMHVLPPPDVGQAAGRVSDRCDASAVEAAVTIPGGDPITRTAGAPDGTYNVWLRAGTYSLTFDAPDYTPYTATVQVQAGQTTTLDVALPPLHPCAAVAPAALEFWVLQGAGDSAVLTVTNRGGADLAFAFLEISDSLVLEGQGGKLEAKPSSLHQDPFTYTVHASDDPGGPAYSWVDIRATGAPLLIGQDAFAGPVDVGFAFPFYGTSWPELYVSSNGFLSFGQGSTMFFNGCPLPDPMDPDNVIALLWDALDPEDTGDLVYYQSFADCPYSAGPCFVVQYENYHHSPGGGALAGTWEAVLFANGSILMQFKDAGAEEGAGSTTGIENGDGSMGLIYACNTPASLHDDLAVCFAYPDSPGCIFGEEVPWVGEDPVSGTVPASSGLGVTVAVTSVPGAILPPGTYAATLRLRSDDPALPLLDVPVTMHVQEYSLAPVAAFTSNAPICLLEPLVLTNTSAPGFPPAAYLWTLGDGITSTLEHPTHTYAAAGLYTVTLEARNQAGSDSYSMPVGVVPPLEIVTVTAAADGCAVTFGAIFSGSLPAGWLWDFGPWGTSTATHPRVDFGASGTYSGTLSAWGCGSTETAFSVTVDCAPVPPYGIYLPLVWKGDV